MTPVEINTDGFTWGPVAVLRWAAFPGRNGRHLVLRIKTGHRAIDVYVSPTGRSVRVFRDHVELKAPITSRRRRAP